MRCKDEVLGCKDEIQGLDTTREHGVTTKVQRKVQKNALFDVRMTKQNYSTDSNSTSVRLVVAPPQLAGL